MDFKLSSSTHSTKFITKTSSSIIQSIGGRDMEKVYQAIDRVIPAENEKAKEKNRDNYATGRNILKGMCVRPGKSRDTLPWPP